MQHLIVQGSCNFSRVAHLNAVPAGLTAGSRRSEEGTPKWDGVGGTLGSAGSPSCTPLTLTRAGQNGTTRDGLHPTRDGTTRDGPLTPHLEKDGSEWHYPEMSLRQNGVRMAAPTTTGGSRASAHACALMAHCRDTMQA